MIAGQTGAGHSIEEVVAEYPHLERTAAVSMSHRLYEARNP
jgi:uncharacterized protein (DUF433 family)